MDYFDPINNFDPTRPETVEALKEFARKIYTLHLDEHYKFYNYIVEYAIRMNKFQAGKYLQSLTSYYDRTWADWEHMTYQVAQYGTFSMFREMFILMATDYTPNGPFSFRHSKMNKCIALNENDTTEFVKLVEKYPPTEKDNDTHVFAFSMAEFSDDE